MEKAAKTVNMCLFLTSIFLGAWGFLLPTDRDVILWATFCVWLCGVFFACTHFRRLFVYFFFELAFFFFLLGRPVMDFLDGNDWVEMPRIYYYPTADAHTAMKIMFCALLFTFVGAWLGNRQGDNNCQYKQRRVFDLSNNMPAIRTVLLLLFLAAFSASLILGMDKIVFVQTHSYAEYYTLYENNFPYIVYVVSTFLEFSLFAYLATLPSKKETVIALVLYVIAGIPPLVVGQRGQIAFSLIFCLVYFLIREFDSSDQRWIGKKELAGIIIGVPILMVFFAIYNYTRQGETVSFSFLEAIKDFVYRQGVTFSWFTSGLGAMQRLPNIDNPHYTFGPIVDYFQYGSFGQLFLGMPGMKDGNNLMRATVGNDLSHHLSYVIMGDTYLAGHGTGSCYLLELFIDFGFFGVILFSFLIGLLFARLPGLIYRRSFASILSLVFVNSVFHIPRGSVSEVFQFLFRPPFWIVIALCIGTPLLLRERFSTKNELMYIHK